METVDFLNVPAAPAIPALANGASPVHDLKRRLTMIMSGSRTGQLTRCGVLAMLGVAMAALAFGPAFAQDRPAPTPERKDAPPAEDVERPRTERPRDDADRPAEPTRRGREAAEAADREEIEKLHQQLERARQEAERAMRRVRELEAAIERSARRPGGADRLPTGPGDGPGIGPMAPGGPMGPGAGVGPPGVGPKGPMGMPGMPGGRYGPGNGFPGGGNERQLQDMQKQIDEMRRLIEELRRDLRRGSDNPRPDPAPRKEPRPFGGSDRGPNSEPRPKQ
jgi:hypothetical protein